MVHIKAKTLTQKVYEVDVNSGSTVLELKNELSKVMENKIIDHEYKIILLGKVLNDDEIINDEHESKLFIVMTTKKKVEEKPVVKPEIQPQINQNNIVQPQLPQENQDILNNIVNNLINQLHNQGGNQLINEFMQQINNFPVDDDSEDEENNDEQEENVNQEDNDEEDNVNPDNNQFNANMIGEFSNNEVDEVNDLVSMGFDYVEVFQMYVATGKNKEATLNILLG